MRSPRSRSEAPERRGWRAIERAPYPADWTSGPAAGQIRNQRMIDRERPAGVIAFPGGDDETADCLRRAEQAGIAVWRQYR